MAVLVISYSRTDQPQVRAIVRLLRGAMPDIERAVFWDDELEPGVDWFEQLKAAIDVAPKLFVMWCHHASQSAQVRREFEYAFDRQKRVVPVLLDSTPLCAELAPIHGIDLREAVIHARPAKKEHELPDTRSGPLSSESPSSTGSRIRRAKPPRPTAGIDILLPAPAQPIAPSPAPARLIVKDRDEFVIASFRREF